MEADGAVIRLVTRCASAEEFIERFARYTTTTDIVVPALAHVSAGTGGHFVICLKDRSVMMQGRCEVTEIQPVAVVPGAATTSSLTALMHLRLREMDAHSCGIHLRLMERHASSPRPPAVLEAVPTAVPALDISAVTVVRDGRPPSDTEPTVISPPPQPETRAPGAAFTLPANPLSDLDAADLASFVEETLLESKGVVGAVPIDSGAIVDGGAQADADPERVMPSGRRSRSDTRPDRARRIIRSAASYASCVIGGLLLGNAFRPGVEGGPGGCRAHRRFTARGRAAIDGAGAAGGGPGPGTARLRRARDDQARGCDGVLGRHRAGVEPDRTRGDSVWHRDRDAAARTLRGCDADDHERAGQSAVVAERLVRPSASVVVTSSPAHAVIRVNKRRVGSAPRTISALQFERVRIEASLPGYQPWRKTLYLRRRSRRSTSGSCVVQRRARDRRRLRRRRQLAQRPPWRRAETSGPPARYRF